MGTGVDAALTGLDVQVAAVIGAGAGVEARLEHSQWPERLIEALNGLAARGRELAEALAPLAGEGQGAFARLRERLEDNVVRLRSLTGEEAAAGCAGPRPAPAT